MSIRTIAVAVTSAREAEPLLAAAADLARHFHAHLTAVRPAQPVIAFEGDIVADPGLAEAPIRWQVEETESIRRVFERIVEGAGVMAEFRAQGSANIGAEPFLLEAVRAADLVLAGRHSRRDRDAEGARLRDQMIRQCGRPVLVVPPERHPTAAVRHLLIGWSDTREATRAAHDALALAAPRARVDLLSVGRGQEEAALALDARQDLAAALDRRGFRVDLVDRQAAAGDIGATLLEAAAERGAELVATGAFGHSRVYDFVIGAVTSYLLERAELPVLLSK